MTEFFTTQSHAVSCRKGCHKSKEQHSHSDATRVRAEEEMAQYILRNIKCVNRLRPVYYPCAAKDTDVKDLLTTELHKSRFTRYRDQFMEEMCFKRADVGQRANTKSIPEHVSNTNQTFGSVPDRSLPLYDIILPKKTREEVIRESYAGHPLYVKSHNHYFPSEQKKRNYSEPFNPNDTFGDIQNIDPNGRFVKRCLQESDEAIVTSTIIKDRLYRNHIFGKKAPSRVLEPPKDAIFGRITGTDECHAQDLLEYQEPCSPDRSAVQAFAYLYSLRHELYKGGFLHDTLRAALMIFDKDHSGYLPWTKVFKMARKHLPRLNEQKLKCALRLLNYLENEGLETERVIWNSFLKLIDMRYPVPKVITSKKYPTNWTTTYDAMCQDLWLPLKSEAKKDAHICEKPTPTAGGLLSLTKKDAQICVEPSATVGGLLSLDKKDAQICEKPSPTAGGPISLAKKTAQICEMPSLTVGDLLSSRLDQMFAISLADFQEGPLKEATRLRFKHKWPPEKFERSWNDAVSNLIYGYSDFK